MPLCWAALAGRNDGGDEEGSEVYLVGPDQLLSGPSVEAE